MDLKEQLSLFTAPHDAFNIRKPSSLVQMSGLSCLDRKTINALILITKDQFKRDKEAKIFTADLAVVKKLSKYLSNNNLKFKDSLRLLQSSSFEYNVFGKDSARRGRFSFLSWIEIVSQR